jgi:hypothetical protein
MKKPLLFTLLLVAGLVVAATPVAAQPQTANLTVTAQVNARAVLTLSSATVAFADADPDTTPSITGSPVLTVTAKSRTSAGNAVTLTVQAGGPLTSGTDTIAVSNVSWTATGDVSAGTLSTSAVTIGSWTSSGNRQGNMTFALTNSWAYATGNYSTTVTFTLSAP